MDQKTDRELIVEIRTEVRDIKYILTGNPEYPEIKGLVNRFSTTEKDVQDIKTNQFRTKVAGVTMASVLGWAYKSKLAKLLGLGAAGAAQIKP